ncbi:MAG: hypothetical protein ACOH2J_19540 [Allorhizobium sp.]
MIPAKRLIALALVAATVTLTISSASKAGILGPGIANVVIFSLALANLAVGVAGLRTPYRFAWGAYVITSIAIFLLLGFATPIGALVILAPIAIEPTIDFSRAFLRPW